MAKDGLSFNPSLRSDAMQEHVAAEARDSEFIEKDRQLKAMVADVISTSQLWLTGQQIAMRVALRYGHSISPDKVSKFAAALLEEGMLKHRSEYAPERLVSFWRGLPLWSVTMIEKVTHQQRTVKVAAIDRFAAGEEGLKRNLVPAWAGKWKVLRIEEVAE